MAQFSDRKFADVFLTKCNSKYYFLTGKLLVQFNSKGGALYLIFCHIQSHSHSHNDIGNVYLLFLFKATG